MAEEKKYKLTDETLEYDGHILHRIMATTHINATNLCVHPGDLGGWIESEKNLSHFGKCWVNNNAKVYGYAAVTRNAVIEDRAVAFDNATVTDFSRVTGNAKIYKNGSVSGYADVKDNSEVFGRAQVKAYSVIRDNTLIYDTAIVKGFSVICGNSKIFENATINMNSPSCLESVFVCRKGIVQSYDDIVSIAVPFFAVPNTITFFRDADDGIAVSYHIFSGGIDQFEKRMLEIGEAASKPLLEKIQKIIAFGKSMIPLK